MNKILESQLQQLPTDPGIYKYFNDSNEVLYVGKAVNLKNRVKSYFVESGLSLKTKALVDEISRMEYIIVQSEMDALILEANLIKEFQPRYNVILKDDKSHLYIKITLYEDWPRVSTCRATDIHLDPRATYFGPFPSGRTVKNTLRLLRRIFPYVAHNQPPVAGRRRPPQSYFYYNLALESSREPVDKKLYRQQIFQLVRFLEGKRQSVTDELEKEMRRAARNLDFELASDIKKQLDGLAYVSQKSISPNEYISNPELIAEKRQQGLRELAGTLSSNLPQINKTDVSHLSLQRIECFDISNISGQFAVGSMVVFDEGEPLKSDYRRFKIKRQNVPNDVAMMEEVLRRRLKRLGKQYEKDGTDSSFSTTPDLIIVDGGKGQLTAVQKVLEEYGLFIPIVGLTKREEELVLPMSEEGEMGGRRMEVGIESLQSVSKKQKPKRSSAHGAVAVNQADHITQTSIEAKFTTIRLARGSEALFIVQRIRDEAHRFAISYHRKLRSKSFLPNK